jgi:class 3 adenylate cyclase
MNFQNCAQMTFVGLGDSYEQYYQAIRRCWRFGQTRPVDIRIVISDIEGAVAANVRRKEKEAARLVDQLVASVSREHRHAA